MFKSFLIVCTGNICRSPIMEGMMKAKLSHHAEIRVTSAGVAALIGHPADPMAVQVAAENGIDISGHRAQQVFGPTLFSSDLVFVMERSHLNWIEENFPAARGRVFLAAHWRESKEVPDPFTMSKETFEESYDLLNNCTNDWLIKLKLTQ